MNGGYGHGDLSEEGLEANNKDFRKFMDSFSRKSDPEKELLDVMHRTLEHSHPSQLPLTESCIRGRKGRENVAMIQTDHEDHDEANEDDSSVSVDYSESD